MTGLAFIVIALWIVMSLWFQSWSKQNNPPEKPTEYKVGSFIYEMCMLALCVWVIFS